MVAFLTLLLTGMLLGFMLTSAFVLPHLAMRYLAPATAGPFVREIQPTCQRGAAAGALVAGLLVIGQLYRGYVEQLADSLRDGSLSLSHDDVVDATTRHTLTREAAVAATLGR